jgi:deoxyribodipyrimidine photo-lyase
MGSLQEWKDNARVTIRRDGEPASNGRCVVYWMQRAQRAFDNPALDVAVDAANALKLPCVIFFAPVPFYPHANLRHYEFLQQGIGDIAEMAEERGVGFVLRRFPEHSLLKFCDEVQAALVIGDENPLRETREWREVAAKKLKVPLWTVDADVIVPTKLLQKEQYAARIIRPRLKAHFKEFLVPCKNPKPKIRWESPRGLQQLDWREVKDITEGWDLDRSVKPVTFLRGGTKEALRLLQEFVTKRLAQYPVKHNQGHENGTTRLSAYLHFGHIGPHTVAMAVEKAKAPQAAKDDFLDQVITWRELSINMVHFNPLYDTFECGENWAHKTLAEHAKDPRPILYTQAQLERGETYDDLWNAAQFQMVYAGWMHNYLRMYWAKKILEWMKTPQQAYKTTVYLNDKYFLDGRDPNGYAGIAWCLVGKFDRPWFPRPIFGTVRYMARSGAEKKFDTAKYIAEMYALAGREQGKDSEAPMLF